ncbi:MAG TPA: amino acid permease [Desulfobacterales bacterium]
MAESASNDDSRPSNGEDLQEQVEKKEAPQKALYGTFGGVFTPTLLTILGVIMYLREGWVVGNGGLLGGALIIVLSIGITAFTGLSLSSITTNIRIGAGGAFNIISQSLGLEVGGSIGIPLYLSQALAVSMYIFGFRAGWQWVFPEHPGLLVDLGVFAVLFIIAFISAGLAFRIQYLIMAIIGLSLISIAVAAFQGSMQHDVVWWGDFRGSPENDFAGVGFWVVFAVFFPASTGIMAGANMSGELKNPRRSIPLGTLSAIGLSLVIYLLLAYWLARSATTEELTSNYTIMIDKAFWGPAVVAGLLGATFSSALSSFVGAPRILQALGDHRILPKGGWFARRTRKGEPRNALLLTALIVFGALMLRNLNAVAPLITMFFLITYAMINVVVLLEQSMKLVSFRPLFRIPRVVSLLGAVGCIFAMVIVNPTFSLVAVVVVLVIHGFLIRKHLKAPFGDVRSGLFVALAEWAAKKVADLAASDERTWKANLLVPVKNLKVAKGNFPLVRDISFPKGFLKLVGLTDRAGEEEMADGLEELSDDFREEKVFASWTVISAATFGDNLQAGIETFAGTFFKPNVIFFTMPSSTDQEKELSELIGIAVERRCGVLLYHQHPEADLGNHSRLNVWFRDRSPDWDLSMDIGNQDLAVLTAYKLKKNWDASLKFVCKVKDNDSITQAEDYLQRLAELARIPNVEVWVGADSTGDNNQVPGADLNLIPMPEDGQPDFERFRRKVEKLGSSAVFTLDSGQEKALA